MSVHLMREISGLKKNILAVCALVEESVRAAAQAISERDNECAERVIRQDDAIDQTEVQVEEECLKILALHQPVAIDLRFIIAVLKINNDLERIGDLAVNIAQRAIRLNNQMKLDVPFDLAGLAAKTQHMLRMSLDALVNLDAGLAGQVRALDDEVDEINRNMYAGVKAMILKQPEHLDALIHLLSVSRNLERIADHATNIAEDVVYMMEGRIVRHTHKLDAQNQ